MTYSFYSTRMSRRFLFFADTRAGEWAHSPNQTNLSGRWPTLVIHVNQECLSIELLLLIFSLWGGGFISSDAFLLFLFPDFYVITVHPRPVRPQKVAESCVCAPHQTLAEISLPPRRWGAGRHCRSGE